MVLKETGEEVANRGSFQEKEVEGVCLWVLLRGLLLLECLLMLKVVFVLKQVVIRLKECEIDVVIRKKNASLLLCNRCKVSNGFASVNTTT